MVFNKEEFRLAINENMAEVQYKARKTYSLQAHAEQIGISTSTLCRILKGKGMDIDTFAAILTWLKKSPKEFIK